MSDWYMGQLAEDAPPAAAAFPPPAPAWPEPAPPVQQPGALARLGGFIAERVRNDPWIYPSEPQAPGAVAAIPDTNPMQAGWARNVNAVRPVSGEGRTESEESRAANNDPYWGMVETALNVFGPTKGGLKAAAVGLPILAASTSDAEAASTRLLKHLPYLDKLFNAKTGELVKKTADPFTEAGNWLVKYDQSKPYLSGADWHGFSGLRGKDLDEMAFNILNPRTPQAPVWDIADLQKKKASLVLGVADRTATGGEVAQIGDIKLGRPVAREGGIAYPQYHADTPVAGAPPGARRAFANAPGAASGINNTALEVLKQGRTPYFVPLSMGKGAGDSSIPVADAALQVARQSEPTKGAISYVNRRVKEADKTFPGLMHDDAPDWINQAKGKARRALVEALDMKPARMGGVADMGEVRVAMTDPRLLRAPTGSGGLTIAKMAPELGVTSDSLHSTYPRAFMSPSKADIGGLQGPLPFHMIARDTHRGLMQYDPISKYAERGADYIMRGVPEGVSRVQPVDQRMVDAVSEFYRKHPLGWR